MGAQAKTRDFQTGAQPRIDASRYWLSKTLGGRAKGGMIPYREFKQAMDDTMGEARDSRKHIRISAI